MEEINLEHCLDASFEIIEKNCDCVDENHSRVLNIPTINHKALYAFMKGNWTNYLGVIGSFYPALNAMMMGAKNLTLFDKNELCIPFCYLFIAAIETLEYPDFLKFTYYSKEESFYSLFYYQQIRKNLTGNVKAYWDTIYHKYHDGEGFCHMLFERDIYHKNIEKYIAPRLQEINLFLTPKTYHILKERLKKAKITFLNEEFADIPILFPKEQFDKIYLSCLNNYYQGSKEKEYFKILEEYLKMLKKNGVMQGALLYDAQIEDFQGWVNIHAAEMGMKRIRIPDRSEPTYFFDEVYLYEKRNQ